LETDGSDCCMMQNETATQQTNATSVCRPLRRDNGSGGGYMEIWVVRSTGRGPSGRVGPIGPIGRRTTPNGVADGRATGWTDLRGRRGDSTARAAVRFLSRRSNYERPPFATTSPTWCSSLSRSKGFSRNLLPVTVRNCSVSRLRTSPVMKITRSAREGRYR
jgi:hypothetical protein